ncbi:predicted protein [Chaetomium globosum CBS 148.51]|uniref:Uncharacterized protein n=1 Tax=Chaetomium globosum (strain ATCC 6205 / CBS 148.51 / DSM 1962 / NBRC 6347 / NRRL 1970) TaxID=306901 RepID=Q2HBC3_CHAGB|nr:uncharacterized protein CHGG_02481 [Chaetomium globosum CBS 148.51]EAQ90546.1 predicted protein [Chaetomium globosum CBS 148.51]
MPAKTREYYMTTSPNRDFAWFFFRTPTPQPPRRAPKPPPPSKVPQIHLEKMAPMTEGLGEALMTPAHVKTRGKVRLEPSKPKKPNSKNTGVKNGNPWSEWYVSDDGNYFWRAREARNGTWEYQFTPGHQEPAPTQDSTPTSSIGELNRPLSPIAEQSLGSPTPSLIPDPTSPKNSWPTILTASTGHPTEDMSASSGRTLVTLPREVEDGNQFETTLAPLYQATNVPGTRNNDIKRNTNKRPVGPVMRLLQESRSRKNRAKTEATKSTANNNIPWTTEMNGDQPQQGGDHNNSGSMPVVKNKMTVALAKKLHARVRAEKELRVDPKRRVKNWLKGVELDLEPIPLDAEGFPLYY